MIFLTLTPPRPESFIETMLGRRLPLGGLLLLMSVTPAMAGEGSGAALSLQDAIEKALATNHDVAMQRINQTIASEKVKIARGVFDPKLEGSYNYQNIKMPQNAQDYVATGGTTASSTALSQPTIFEQENKISKAALVQRLPTGTTLELSTNLRVLDNTLNRRQPPALFSPEYESYSGFSITQPLLKDFGLKANLAELRIAKSNVKIADLEWRSHVAAMVGEVVKRYHDVIFTYEHKAIQAEAIQLAEKLLEDNTKKSAEGVLAPNEVLVAEAGLYQRKEEALVAEGQYVERQNALQLLFKQGDDESPSVRIEPTSKMEGAGPVPTRAELLALAKDSRYDIMQVLEVAKQRHYQTDYAKNQVLPRLDLVASGGYHGLAGDTSSSYSRGLDRQGPEWSVGVSVSIPLGFGRARAAARVAQAQESQAAVDVDRVRAQISLEIDTVLSRIATDSQRVEAVGKSREAAVKTLEGEVKRQQEGVSTSYQVLQMQKEYSLTRSRQLAAQADLSKDHVDLWLITGQLLAKRGITVVSPGDLGKASAAVEVTAKK